jgi:electron transfer flavoprotein beta subunit
MHIAVCLAPIIDPKLPPIRLNLRIDGRDLKTDDLARQLGPFDQAALETALKLRDADASVTILALLFTGPDGKVAVQDVMSRRIEDTICIEPEDLEGWDIAAACQRFKCAISELSCRPNLVLIGREFGDCDDGVFPALLAEALAWPFVGHVHAIRRVGDELVLRRDLDNTTEEYQFAGPVVASITNHPSNRLRYPLMKDMMAAKKRTARTIRVRPTTAEARVVPTSLEIVSFQERGAGRCRILAGSPRAQAETLAEFLAPWIVAP